MLCQPDLLPFTISAARQDSSSTRQTEAHPAPHPIPQIRAVARDCAHGTLRTILGHNRPPSSAPRLTSRQPGSPIFSIFILRRNGFPRNIVIRWSAHAPPRDASIAQLVEHRSRKAGVIGSSPIAGSSDMKTPSATRAFFGIGVRFRCLAPAAAPKHESKASHNSMVNLKFEGDP